MIDFLKNQNATIGSKSKTVKDQTNHLIQFGDTNTPKPKEFKQSQQFKKSFTDISFDLYTSSISQKSNATIGSNSETVKRSTQMIIKSNPKISLRKPSKDQIHKKMEFTHSYFVCSVSSKIKCNNRIKLKDS